MTVPATTPTLRCPACAFMTPLPAVRCDRCGANLSTGYAPPDESFEKAARLKKRLLAALALALILGLAALFFALSAPGPSASRPAAAPAGDVEAAVETIQSLAEQPVGVRPDIVINRAKAVTGQAQTRRDGNARGAEEE